MAIATRAQVKPAHVSNVLKGRDKSAHVLRVAIDLITESDTGAPVSNVVPISRRGHEVSRLHNEEAR